jgi:hypothetical protein
VKYLGKEPFSVGGALPSMRYYQSFPTAAIGKEFCESDGTTWVVVSVSEECVQMSGPGPCRGYQEVGFDRFFSEYDEV